MKYRIKYGSHGRVEGGELKIYNRGDVVELTRDVAKGLGDQVERVTDRPLVEDEDAPSEAGEPATPPAPVAKPVAPLAPAIKPVIPPRPVGGKSNKEKA